MWANLTNTKPCDVTEARPDSCCRASLHKEANAVCVLSGREWLAWEGILSGRAPKAGGAEHGLLLDRGAAHMAISGLWDSLSLLF